MHKKSFILISLSLLVLPACLRVPKIKSIYDVTIISENDTEQQNGPIVFNAKKLNSYETHDFVGFVPNKYSFGIPWFVTFTNTGTKYFYLNEKSWKIPATDPEAIITKFTNAYRYNGLYLTGATLASWLFCASLIGTSLFIGMFSMDASHIVPIDVYIIQALAAAGFIITPVAAGIIYKNNRAQLPLSILTLEENLLPINSILYPDGTIQGIVFLPKETDESVWQVTLFDTEDTEYAFRVNSFDHEKINEFYSDEII
jgi:hypothetical protein